jgi:OFA family oxalate/formate antiporter-like MFS transporter
VLKYEEYKPQTMADHGRLLRWGLLVIAAGAMGAAGTYQFVWSSIRPVLGTRLSMTEGGLGTVFTVYVICQTLSQFPAGWFRDRYGPRIPLAVGAGLVTAGYLGTAYADGALAALFSYALGGVGAGLAFTVAVNTPVKWFEDRRGLATGLVTMAYGGSSVLIIPSVRSGLAGNFSRTLTLLGAGVGVACLAGALALRDPPQMTDDSTADGPASRETYAWHETVRTWQFWLLYLVMIVVNAVGLMIIGKAVAAAQHYGITTAAATATASALALADGAGIVLFGGLSDRFGRERIIAVTLVLCGIATVFAVRAGEASSGPWFVLLLGAAAFFRSPVFAVAPSLLGEYYGPARSSENYALLYTSKVWGGVGGGVVASLLVATVGWSSSFLAGGVAVTAAGLLTTRLEPVEADLER